MDPPHPTHDVCGGVDSVEDSEYRAGKLSTDYTSSLVVLVQPLKNVTWGNLEVTML